MARPQNSKRRFLGPYYEGKIVRYIAVDPLSNTEEGRRSSCTFTNAKDAQDWIEGIKEGWKDSDGRTIGAALDAFEKSLGTTNSQESVENRMRRLRLFFDDVIDDVLVSLRADRAAHLYEEFQAGRSVDYHRNTLGNAKGFIDWCIKRDFVTANPFAKVEGVGNRKQGKPQLTGNESRLFLRTALRMADHDEGALGSLMLLLMGLRQSEVWKRQARDVDLDGTVLRVEDAKTKKGDRLVDIPPVLQARLVEQAEGKEGTALLFDHKGGPHTRAWLHAAVRRVCRAAGVPVVCPHGLRGTFATIAMQIGGMSRAVADALGHEDPRTTMQHYAARGSATGAQQKRALATLEGNRSGFVPKGDDDGGLPN